MRSPLCIGVLFCLSIVSSCGGETALDQTAMTAILRKAEAAQNKRIPKPLIEKRGRLEKGDYDPNAYLAIFSRLGIASGQVLDFVYDLQDLGGHPIVYARDASRSPDPDLASFKKDHPRRYFLGDRVRYEPAYLNAIKTDDTPDGFLQLAWLVLTGEQFYLHWHAVYYRYWPVTDRETLTDMAKSLPENLRPKAMALDFTPRATMGATEVTVEYVVFNAWEGFKRVAWKVSRPFPHRLLEVRETSLLEYKSQLRF